MPTMKQVKEQIARLPSEGRYLFWTSKEVRSLPSILEDDERIYAITSGFVENNTWLLVCTDRRIFLDRGWLYGLKQIQMPLNRINSIDHEIGIAFGTISIWDGATRMTVGTILRSKVHYFVKIAKKAMEDYNQRVSMHYQQQMMMQQQQQQQMMQQQQQPQMSPEQQAQRMSDMAQHLEKLAALRDKGILTEEEFQAQKARMLQG